MHFNHLSKEIVVLKDQDADADADEVDDELADENQPKKQRDTKKTSSTRSLRRRSNSFHKLIKAFRLQDELVDNDSEELEGDVVEKEDSQKFEPVHVPPPNQHRHHRLCDDNQDEAKDHHLHEALLLSLVAKSAKSSDVISQANTQQPPTSAASSCRHSNPFDSGDVFDKLHASSSSMDSLCLDDLCAMAKMDVIQRDTEREIRAHLDQQRHHNKECSLVRDRDEHEAAVLRATLHAYATHSSSMSCAIESISLTEFDGLIMPKSEVPIDVSSEHRHLWRPHNPSLHRKISATTA